MDTRLPMDVARVFAYHTPTPEQLASLERLREAASRHAEVIMAETKVCADQSTALRHVRDASMTANAAVMLDGRLS